MVEQSLRLTRRSRPSAAPAVARQRQPVCRACPASWGCKSPVQPDGGEAL